MEPYCLLSYKDRMKAFMVSLVGTEKQLISGNRSQNKTTGLFNMSLLAMTGLPGTRIMKPPFCVLTPANQYLSYRTVTKKTKKKNSPTSFASIWNTAKHYLGLTCSHQITYKSTEIAWPTHSQSLAKAASTNSLVLPRAGILTTIQPIPIFN